MADVRKLKPFILKWEGGFVDDPADLGGATNKGVTIGTYKEYRKKKGLPEPTVEDLKKLSDDEWTEFDGNVRRLTKFKSYIIMKEPI